MDAIRSSTDQRTTFLVYLTTQADLAPAFRIQEWDSRGDRVFQILQNTAQQSQAELIGYLEGQQQSGNVSSYRPFYIVNAISVTAGLDVLNDLAARPDVAYIEAEQIFHVPEPIPVDNISVDAVE